MRCPSCGSEDVKVIDSRAANDDAAIRRRRECEHCGHRFTTYETIQQTPLMVVKSDGSSQVFKRDKLMHGLVTACAKRDIAPATLEALVDDIESELQSSPQHQVRSHTLGDMVMHRLAHIDDVAYIRFASVYKDFKSIREFKQALEGM
ncbi:MAG: transcriptional regulator NrdR [Coriobacteriales bacterium]|jgi:transcriptional repressor NrdR|nr:transcriptional regulator NrdR [Coriobacteriales bacterium]